MTSENKKRIPLWIYPSTLATVDRWMAEDNCRSRSEYIEKAVRFYSGYVSSGDAVKYLPLAITSVVSGTVQLSEDRISRLLFKLAVEMSMMMNILAANTDVDELSLSKLRGMCINNVKKSIGSVHFEDALKYQRGEI